MKTKKRKKTVTNRPVPCPTKLRMRILENLRQVARSKVEPTRAKRARKLLAAGKATSVRRLSSIEFQQLDVSHEKRTGHVVTPKSSSNTFTA